MLEEQKEMDVYESRRFEKALGKLSESQLKIVEDEIENILDNPELGELKKGDLSHIRVHKFKMDTQQVLLGYSWVEDKIEIYLLHLGPHENFYKKASAQRKVDLRLIKP
ncbi:type II toxin-antitoxin system RelE/ParE family toxin [Moritella sp.]|uniref:type II toxin-antitoxin system RelE/ParE family toxin n=1 Tax=Moritella sp. TaxID=78556 RepID=UPI0025CDB9B0|nr:type II toxin-antitoxin system RelE/ParE family toxin [Moritella sp.]MCJ8348285.1 type II toxin-antitoxin system RelE/ParE family toxin [Moritella sp.]